MLASTFNSFETPPNFAGLQFFHFFSFLFLSFLPSFFLSSRKLGVSFSPLSDRFAFVEAPAGLGRTYAYAFGDFSPIISGNGFVDEFSGVIEKHDGF